MEISKGMKLSIQSYKHDEKLHRVWVKTIVIEKNKDVLVTAHHATKVLECTGRSWFTREPAVCYFFEHEWFNVIGMLKKDGLYFYCNLASPYLYDGEAIKYIDYDLDVKVFPNGTHIVLDRNEYKYHAKLMKYPEEVKTIIEAQLIKLETLIKAKAYPFNLETVKKHYEMYLSSGHKKSGTL